MSINSKDEVGFSSLQLVLRRVPCKPFWVQEQSMPWISIQKKILGNWETLIFPVLKSYLLATVFTILQRQTLKTDLVSLLQDLEVDLEEFNSICFQISTGLGEWSVLPVAFAGPIMPWLIQFTLEAGSPSDNLPNFHTSGSPGCRF